MRIMRAVLRIMRAVLRISPDHVLLAGRYALQLIVVEVVHCEVAVCIVGRRVVGDAASWDAQAAQDCGQGNRVRGG